VKFRFKNLSARNHPWSYPDQILLFTVLFLLAFGLIMVYSSSSVISMHERDDSLHYFRLHFLRVGFGLGLMLLVTFLDYRKLMQFAGIGLLAGIILLILVFVPGLGVYVNGGRRWIDIGLLRFQPSEVFKVCYILWLSRSLMRIPLVSSAFKRVILPEFLILGLVFFLIDRQPNMSTALVVSMIGMSMIFLMYPNWWILGGIGAVGVAGSLYLVLVTPYRLKRAMAFFDPWENQLGSGYQIIQSYVSLGSGGLSGLGLGQSRQKFFYLPEEHTDFIFAILGEEFGFVGCAIVVFAFMILAWRGFKIALNTEELFGRLMAYGITVYIMIQALINLLVVSGLIPPTGVPLPFISYGGTALVINLVSTGFLLAISRYCRYEN